MPKQFSYPVFAFRQQTGSPIQVAFVAPAGEILDWAGVPRKSDELLTGYQRFCDPNRVNQEIVPFFQNPMNCSPTAIILALRADSGFGTCTLDGIENLATNQVMSTTMRITLGTDDDDPQSVFNAASNYVNTRLRNAAGEEADEEETDDQEDTDETGSEGEDDGEGLVVHLGSETLIRMKRLLDNRDNWNNEGFRKSIVDYIKPAFLIDGQHRVTAASRLGVKGLPFMVCGLYDAAWEEQVFQFTVVNLKPRKIPPNTITSIAALSLTRGEQNKLEERLEAAGVKMWEVTLMSHVSFDTRSPYYEKVDMAVGGPSRGELLGYGSMKRIAAVWFRCRYSVLVQLAKVVTQSGSDSRAKRAWQDENCWFEFFCAFWGTIRDHYTERLWVKGDSNRLFNGATLWALQEAMLQAMSMFPSSTWSISDDITETSARSQELEKRLKDTVANMIRFFPEEVWTTAWARGSQDTSSGREELANLFEVFIKKGNQSDGSWSAWRTDSATKSWFQDGVV